MIAINRNCILDSIYAIYCHQKIKPPIEYSMSKYVKIVNEDNEVVDAMHCLHEDVAERVLCNLINHGADVYMQDISGLGTIFISDLKVSNNDPLKNQAELIGHLPFLLNDSEQYVASDSTEFKDAMSSLVSELQTLAKGGVQFLSSSTHSHPYAYGAHIIKITAIAEDFNLQLNDVIELPDVNDHSKKMTG
jgi:hypothetical protein